MFSALQLTWLSIVIGIARTANIQFYIYCDSGPWFIAIEVQHVACDPVNNMQIRSNGKDWNSPYEPQSWKCDDCWSYDGSSQGGGFNPPIDVKLFTNAYPSSAPHLEFTDVLNSWLNGTYGYTSLDLCNPAPTTTTTKTPMTTIPTNNPSKTPTTNNPTLSPTDNPTLAPTVQPIYITTQPTTAQPTTSQPTTSQPTTTEPTSEQPTTSLPTTTPPTTVQSTSSQSTTSVSITSATTTDSSTTSLPTTSVQTTYISTNTSIVYILITVIVIMFCCIVIYMVYAYYKHIQKDNHFKNDDHEDEFDYILLTKLHPDDRYQTSTITKGESTDVFDDMMIHTTLTTEGSDFITHGNDEEIDGDGEAELYTKPTETSGGITAGKEVEIIHFYYTSMEYIEEKENEDNIEIGGLYHEKQEWEMCLMHALNALLQKKQFSVKTMNDICKELAPNKLINPHKSVLKTGNYDANVLMMALSKMNIDVEWFDRRKSHQLNLQNDNFLNYLEPGNKTLIGFILNNPQKAMFKMFTRRHWIAIKKINGVWYNLDSKLKRAKKYKNAAELTAFLSDNLNKNNAELMICRKDNKFKQKKVQINVSINW